MVGFFNSGMYEFDSRFIYMDIKDADRFFEWETALRGLGIKITNQYRAREVDDRLRAMLSARDWGTNNWINMNQNLFSYMKIEKILMFLMLMLITLVAAFNLVGMLTMVIMEKRREIGILRSMGMSGRGIMSIFMIEGTAIGVAGTLAGSALGFIACLIPGPCWARPAGRRIFHQDTARAGSMAGYRSGVRHLHCNLLSGNNLPELGGQSYVAGGGDPKYLMRLASNDIITCAAFFYRESHGE